MLFLSNSHLQQVTNNPDLHHRLLSTLMRSSWILSLKKSFTEQPALPEDAQAQAQAQDEAHAHDDAQAHEDAQEE